ncbi:hypothetical protein B296_00004074 [Ensete ventricosum]|uniref:NLP1-9 GAF domain-containing protein n=1 Tax=Ensete ventricosum TaxID=4639 RepID=A0A427B7T7_ENSVE|nr:hypothetical protein B296_00004074 [Ensete ventricosum]
MIPYAAGPTGTASRGAGAGGGGRVIRLAPTCWGVHALPLPSSPPSRQTPPSKDRCADSGVRLLRVVGRMHPNCTHGDITKSQPEPPLVNLIYQIKDDLSALSELMDLDGFTEAWSPTIADQIFSILNFSDAQQTPATWASFISPSSVAAQGTKAVPGDTNDDRRENMASQKADLSLGLRNSYCRSYLTSDDISSERISTVTRPFGSVSLTERMLKALLLFKESSCGGILAQVWMPIVQGDQYVLSTSDQPFLLDKNLAGYREVSRNFIFHLKEAPGMFTGLPGRVFVSRTPEWTSDVTYYKKIEYMRVDDAVNHQVRGSLAVPVLDPRERSCCAVLELVTMVAKPNFDTERENICNALQVSASMTFGTM